MKNPRVSADKVEQEIERLQKSDLVKLASKEQQIKQDKRRKYLAQLRWLEKRGKELEAAGVTMENIKAFVEAATEE